MRTWLTGLALLIFVLAGCNRITAPPSSVIQHKEQVSAGRDPTGFEVAPGVTPHDRPAGPMRPGDGEPIDR